MKKSKILSIKGLGKKKTFNIEMKSKQHNYLIKNNKNNNIVSKNSTAYGYIAYQTAWLKTYYPTEFICATLTVQSQKDEEKLDISKEKFLTEYKKLKILPVDVNKSKLTFYPEDDLVVRAPLDSIKGIGPKASEEIVKNQPYVSAQDFMARAGYIHLNTREIQIIQECGALNSLGDPEFVAKEITSYTRIAEMTAKKKKVSNISAKNLF